LASSLKANYAIEVVFEAFRLRSCSRERRFKKPRKFKKMALKYITANAVEEIYKKNKAMHGIEPENH